MATPSLASVYERELGLRVPKADRLTDWLRRPLTEDQLQYAASDVAHLLDVHARLTEQLTERGRLQWALDECEQLRIRQRGARDPPRRGAASRRPEACGARPARWPRRSPVGGSAGRPSSICRSAT